MSLLGRLLGGETLTQALRRGAQHGTPKEKASFRQALLRERLLLLAQEDGSETPLLLSPKDAPEQKAVLAFINRAALLRGRYPATRVLALQGREALMAALEAQADLLHINPAGPDGTQIQAAEMRQILEGSAPDRRNKVLE
jgi:hypothetical protein